MWFCGFAGWGEQADGNCVQSSRSQGAKWGGREVVLGMMSCVRDTGVDVTGLGLCWERNESKMTAAKFGGWV